MGFQHRSLASVLAAIVLAALSIGCSRKDTPTAPQAGQRDALTAQAAKDLAGHFAASLSRQKGVPIDRLGGTSLEEPSPTRAGSRGRCRSRSSTRTGTSSPDTSMVKPPDSLPMRAPTVT